MNDFKEKLKKITDCYVLVNFKKSECTLINTDEAIRMLRIYDSKTFVPEDYLLLDLEIRAWYAIQKDNGPFWSRIVGTDNESFPVTEDQAKWIKTYFLLHEIDIGRIPFRGEIHVHRTIGP